MKRNFEIDELRAIGFVVKSNFKEQTDRLEMKDGSRFKAWIGKNSVAHVCVNEIQMVEIDKNYETAILLGKDNEYKGTIFDFTEIRPRSYGEDMELV